MRAVRHELLEDRMIAICLVARQIIKEQKLRDVVACVYHWTFLRSSWYTNVYTSNAVNLR